MLVVSLLGVDGERLEWTALYLVKFVLDSAVSFVEVRRREQPVASCETVVLAENRLIWTFCDTDQDLAFGKTRRWDCTPYVSTDVQSGTY